MKRNGVWLMRWTTVLLLCGAAAALVVAQEKPEPPKPLKADPYKLAEGGLATVYVRDCAALRAAWRESFLAKLLAEKELQPFLKSMRDKGGVWPYKFLDEMAKMHTKCELKDLLKAFNGALMFNLRDVDVEAAQRGRPTMGDVIKMLFALQTGAAKETWDKFLGALCDAIRESTGPRGPAKSVQTHKGVKVHGFGNEEATFFGAFLADTWLLTLDLDTMRKAIGRAQAGGGTASFLDGAEVKSLLAAAGFGGKEHLVILASLKNLLDLFTSEMGDTEKKQAEVFLKRMPKTVGFVMGPAENGMYREVLVSQFDEKGFEEIRSAAGKVTAPKGLLSRSDDIYIFGLLGAGSLTQVWKTVMEQARAEWERRKEWMPDAPDPMEQKKEFEKKSGVNIEKDLLAQLGENVEVYVVRPAGGGAFPEMFSYTKVKDGAKLAEAVDKLLGAIQKQIKEKGGGGGDEFKLYEKKIVGDTTMFLLPIPKRELTSDLGTAPWTPTILLQGDKLVLATQPSVARAVARRVDDRYQPRRLLKSFLSSANGSNGGWYLNMPAVAGYAYNTFLPLLRKDRWTMRRMNRMGIDLDLLPGAEVVTEHFPPFYAVARLDAERRTAVTELRGKGFGLLGTAGTVFSYLMLCAAAVEMNPQKMVLQKMRAHEHATVMALRNIGHAQALYRMDRKKYASSNEELLKSGYIDKENFETPTHTLKVLGGDEEGFSAVATPKEGEALKRRYFLDQTGKVRYSDTEEVGPKSPVWEPGKLPGDEESKLEPEPRRVPKKVVVVPVAPRPVVPDRK